MRDWRDIASDEFTVTKRHLGWLLLVAGLLILAAAVMAEIVNTETSEFGTVQKLITLVGALSVLVGVTLLPLGNRPA